MKKKELTEQEQFWHDLTQPLPPPYAKIEARTKEKLVEMIEHLETLNPYESTGRYYGRYRQTNGELLEYYKKQYETYRVIRPGEIEEKEEQDTLKDMADILGRMPK